ncbi:protein toll-like [Hyposmocoma kahamanoa]|uniref:protein toll-like n=1 Tax=Hyposmocoma kahamanoa TaxID=1477025 RepID=UPI000E6D63C8|nr:protein toll-like [Hyposmocoma kahamanoa]
MKIISTLPTLRALDLTDVYLPNFCNHFNKSKKFNLITDEVDKAVEPFNVTILDLEGTGMSRLCFADWPSLRDLYLYRNNISVLEVNQLPINKTGLMRVYLDGNPVRRVEFDEKNYEFLKSRTNFTRLEVIMNFTLDCDCHGAWFARAARDYVITAILAGCSDGTPLTIVPPERVECDKFSCEGCICRRLWKDNMTRANCTARGLLTLPRVPALKEINASNNLIETIYAHDLPQTLQSLDLRNNRLARLDEAVVVALFEIPNRGVQLSGNPIICDCENKPFLEALRDHRTQVDDYNNVTCAGDGKTMDEVDFDELCDAKKILLTVTLAVSGMLIGLAALVGALYCRYEKTIKIFLYARGICLFCMAEDELDAEREYDAFVSFAHEDEQFVMEELVVYLEKEYKICVHYRDWIVGDMIPTQITRSVENSRRTIIVLSKKFVKSLWGLLEFKTAHFCALSEGRVRVIVLVIDDVTEDDTLDLQLRGYLLTNTYLKWGDPWFWDKLKYAMPRKGMVETETVPRTLSDLSNFNRSNMLRMGIELPALPSPTTC